MSVGAATVTTSPVRRGEHDISRKAIAQGMSDCLRCPVCSCAQLFIHIAHETAGAARIRHSLRPLIWRGAKVTRKPRADRAARTPMHVCSNLQIRTRFRRPGLDPGPIRRILSVRTLALDTFRQISAAAYGSRRKAVTTRGPACHTHCISGTHTPERRYHRSPAPINFAPFAKRSVHPRASLRKDLHLEKTCT
jgi:hypothetical protein